MNKTSTVMRDDFITKTRSALLSHTLRNSILLLRQFDYERGLFLPRPARACTRQTHAPRTPTLPLSRRRRGARSTSAAAALLVAAPSPGRRLLIILLITIALLLLLLEHAPDRVRDRLLRLGPIGRDVQPALIGRKGLITIPWCVPVPAVLHNAVVLYRRTIMFSYIVSTNHKSRLRIPTCRASPCL